MDTGVSFSPVRYFAHVDGIAENVVKGCEADGAASRLRSASGLPNRSPMSFGFEQIMNRCDTSGSNEGVENAAHCGLFGAADDQLAAFQIISERRVAASPESPLFHDHFFVAHPITGNFPFELGEGQQDIAD
jgi:hypothetical protein